MIIGLVGPAGCGKSTGAAFLAERYGFARVRFAGPLKAMVRAFLAESGAPAPVIEAMIEGELKELPSPLLAGRSPRYMMQRLGAELGRDLMGPDLWVDAWTSGASAALARGAPGVVVEDVRYPNEAEAVRRLGGRITRIERAHGTVALAAHSSEGQEIPFDARLINNGTVEVLHARLEELTKRFGARAA